MKIGNFSQNTVMLPHVTMGLGSTCAEFANTVCYTLWRELKQIGK